MTKSEKDVLLVMKESLQLLDKAADILNYSYGMCSKIGLKDVYTYEELDRFEPLTGRFARLNDLLIKRIFRLIDEIELETPGTVIDRINRAEKRRLIESAAAFAGIREVRKALIEESSLDEIQGLFKKVLQFTPYLLDSVNRVKKHCKKYL